MRFFLWLVFAVLIAAPAAAQDQSPVAQTAPGLVIVGHGPDVPNADSEAANTLEPAAIVAPMVVIVPVPVVVAPAHHHSRSDVPRAAAEPAANPTGQFINDPSRRFLNDASRRFLNPPVRPTVPNGQ